MGPFATWGPEKKTRLARPLGGPEVEAILGFCNVGPRVLGRRVILLLPVIPTLSSFISVIATTEIGQSNMVEMQ